MKYPVYWIQKSIMRQVQTQYSFLDAMKPNNFSHFLFVNCAWCGCYKYIQIPRSQDDHCSWIWLAVELNSIESGVITPTLLCFNLGPNAHHSKSSWTHLFWFPRAPIRVNLRWDVGTIFAVQIHSIESRVISPSPRALRHDIKSNHWVICGTAVGSRTPWSPRAIVTPNFLYQRITPRFSTVKLNVVECSIIS